MKNANVTLQRNRKSKIIDNQHNLNEATIFKLT